MLKLLDAFVLLLAICVISFLFAILLILSMEAGKSVVILSIGYFAVMACFIVGLFQTFTE